MSAPIAPLAIKAAPIDRLIVIAPAAKGRFRVAVVPRLDGEPAPSVFATHREAKGFAGGIRLVRGWPIEDQTR